MRVSCTDMFCPLQFNTWSSYYYPGPKKTVLWYTKMYINVF
jgi:hypothetical protein